MYVDDLSNRLSKSNNGCSIDNLSINHIYYADDLCLMAPSAKGLQNMLDICEKYGQEYDILYNPVRLNVWLLNPKDIN